MRYYALVREVPDSFPDALRDDPAGPAPDLRRARTEHAAYLAALVGAGYELITIPPEEAHPDCPFVEDAGVIVGDVALVTRPGAPARRGEVEAVAAALAGHFPIERMAAPATLDGGDVLQVGGRIFVGRSGRTNEAGIRRLAEVAWQVNESTENIGARRLHTVLERLLEQISYEAPDLAGSKVLVDAAYVDEHLTELAGNDDLAKYIL